MTTKKFVRSRAAATIVRRRGSLLPLLVALLLLSAFLEPRAAGISSAQQGEQHRDDNNNRNNNNDDDKAIRRKKKIAVIGGAVSGSFVTKYLAEYDAKTNCSSGNDGVIDSITVYEPMPLDGPIDNDAAVTAPPNDDDHWQGSRVQSLRLSESSSSSDTTEEKRDDVVVELGASIGFKEFHLINEMIRNDPDHLVKGKPFNTGRRRSGTETKDGTDDDDEEERQLHKGMGIYSGNGVWNLLTSAHSDYVNKLLLLWRYGWDLVSVSRVCDQMLAGFARLPSLLDDVDDPDTYFESPDEVWESVNLRAAVHASFDDLLDKIGIADELPAWRRYLVPYQGSLRKELLTAINLVNYNQNNSQVNGIVGLGSFAASSGGLFSIVGGNAKLIGSAFRQARSVYDESCGGGGSRSDDKIKHVQKKVTTVVGSVDGLTLYSSDEESLGTYDVVILATPMQQSRIEFLVQSAIDEAVLQPMPMRTATKAEKETHRGEGEHNSMLPSNRLLDSAVRPYTQVVTTVVSNATLSAEAFSLDDESSMPRSIVMTAAGKASTHNITAITQLTKTPGVYKMFSNDKLPADVLTNLFGPGHRLEYVKFWGGPHGGATPDYRGQGTAHDFLLYDGAAMGMGDGGALYYPSAMEQSSLACMELSAVGAKAVAKLVARRLGLVQPVIDSRAWDPSKDEL